LQGSNDIQHNDIQHNNKKNCDTQLKDKQHNGTFDIPNVYDDAEFTLSVVMLNVPAPCSEQML